MDYFIPILSAITVTILGLIGFRYYRFRKKYGNYELSKDELSNLWGWK